MGIPLTEKPNAESVAASHGGGIVVEGRYLAPPTDKDGKKWVRTSALVQADPQDLYAIWRNVLAAPMWQEDIVSVLRTGEKTSLWTMRSGDKTIEWHS